VTARPPTRRARTGILAYLYSSLWVHRLVPLRLAVPLLAAYGRRRWRRDAGFREAEIAYRSLIVHGTDRHGEGPEIARAAAEDRLAKRELEWRPWVMGRTRLTGLEHFEAAKTEGRGVIITTAHTGIQGALGKALTMHGHELHAPAGDWMFTEQREGYQGRVARTMLKITKQIGVHMVPRGGTFDRFAELLRQGEVAFLPFDVPGTTQAQFLGKHTNLTSGPVALAMETGALVVAGFSWREGHKPYARMHPPIDPRTFEDADSLRRAIAGVVEPAILEQAHSMSTVFTPYLWAEDWPTYFG
jgi:hypothetical protein